MKHLLILACVIMGVGHCLAQGVVINEIMYAPVKPEPEWIELFNLSDSVISIKGWVISNHLRTYQLLPDTIEANGYLILTKDSANFLLKKYHIPNAHILETTLPSLVNTGDDIVIRDSTNHLIDSIFYSPHFGGGSGISLERIDYSAPADSGNFGNCTDSLRATPGLPNSIRRRDFDLAIDALTYSKVNDNDLFISVTILNKGRKSISAAILTLNSTGGIPILQTQLFSPIPPLEKQNIELAWHDADFGKSPVIANINCLQDELHSNDSLHAIVYLPIPRNAVIINEIMATPASSSSEWVELYNNSASIAHIDSTILEIGYVDTSYTFLIDSFALRPNHYVVIDASTKFFSQFPALSGAEGMVVIGKSSFNLEDSGSTVMFVNSDKSVIDSLHYSSAWHSPNVTDHTGISLERKQPSASGIDKHNWNSSFDPRGSTPLERNSYAIDTTPVSPSVAVHISPNPFSPDGDGFDDAANITITIPGESEEVISVKLYDLRGRLRSTVALNQRVLRSESLRFEGKDDNGITLPIGLYTLVVEPASGAFKPQRTGLVIMKKPP